MDPWARDSGAKLCCAGRVPEQATPHNSNTPPAAAPSGARASPPRSPAPPPAAAPPGARAPRRRLQTGLGLPWLGSETSLLRSLRRPRRRAPSGPCRGSPGSRPVPCGQPGGASMAWRRRPEARGALALLALALCAQPGPGSRVVLGCGEHRVRGPADQPERERLEESGRFGDSSPKEGARGPGGRPARGGPRPRGLRGRHSLPRAGRRGAAPGSRWWRAGAAPSEGRRCWRRHGGTPRPWSCTTRSATATSPRPCPRG